MAKKPKKPKIRELSTDELKFIFTGTGKRAPAKRKSSPIVRNIANWINPVQEIMERLIRKRKTPFPNKDKLVLALLETAELKGKIGEAPLRTILLILEKRGVHVPKLADYKRYDPKLKARAFEHWLSTGKNTAATAKNFKLPYRVIWAMATKFEKSELKKKRQEREKDK